MDCEIATRLQWVLMYHEGNVTLLKLELADLYNVRNPMLCGIKCDLGGRGWRAQRRAGSGGSAE